MADWHLPPHPERPRPEHIRVFFCTSCGMSTGVEDYDRVRHEHFDNDPRCRNGRFDIRRYQLIHNEEADRG